MAIPKKGSRKIVVNDTAYRWLIRRKATYSQIEYGNGKLHLAVELYDNPKSTLVIVTDRNHPQTFSSEDIIPITPVDIEAWIKEALHLKWLPSQKGAQFRVKIENGILKINNQ